jgi:hypothetical protein
VHAAQAVEDADQAEAVLVRQAEINDQYVVRALDGQALGGPGVPAASAWYPASARER